MRKTSIEDLKNIFIYLGLKKNDNVLVHSSLFSLGIIENGIKGFNSSLREIVGENGTVIVPAFTYSFRRNQTFDVLKTPSPKELGVFSEFIRLHQNSHRSDDPLFSFCAVGPLANKIMTRTTKYCFGKQSIFENFEINKVKILSIGLTYTNGITPFIHIEKLAKVPYRSDKKFFGNVIDKCGIEKKSYAIHYMQNENFFKKNITCREKMGLILEKNKISKVLKFETYCHRLINFSDMIECTLDVLKKEPLNMIKKK